MLTCKKPKHQLPRPAGVLFAMCHSWARCSTTEKTPPQGLHSICASRQRLWHSHPNARTMPARAPNSQHDQDAGSCISAASLISSVPENRLERTKRQLCSRAPGSSQKSSPLQSGILAMDTGSSSLKFSSLCAWPHAVTSGIFCQNSSFVSHNN